MHNRQVPRSEWFRFFREFSRRHDGWLVRVRVLHPSLGSQVELYDVPLEGVVSTPDATGPITIYAGGSPERNLEHRIPAPVQVWVEVSERGVDHALGVVSDDGTKTILEFRTSPAPEDLDDSERS